MTDKQFIDSLDDIQSFNGDKERQVEAVYNDLFKDRFNKIKISNPFKCDGYFETNIKSNNSEKEIKTRIICEYKYNTELSNNVSRSRIICQVLFYLKKFEEAGQIFPNIIFVGDVNECFVLHSNDILKYLDFEGVDWNVAPSSAADNNVDLMVAISNDNTINPFIFDINKSFSCDYLIQKINDIATNVIRLVRITDHNVDTVFSCFKKTLKNVSKIPVNDLVALFFGSITNKDEYYVHPNKKNTLICTNGKTYPINGSSFTAFMNHFSSEYTPKEKARFSEISDRLIEDTTRKNKGEFYTPTPWVDKAHEMITGVFGENWKDEYVVWDCSCGSKNLTRDYRFKELYCSTLEQAELDISKNYNQEATSFVFDFLNETDEDFERKAPNLMKAIKENKKLLFFINPPYGKATGPKVGGMGDGVTTNTMINSVMKKEKIEGSELLKQFLYRICKIKENYNLTDVNVACFTKPSWLIKPQGKSFRDLWFKNFKFESGMMFKASEFADVSSLWGITFNIWTTGIQSERNNFLHNLCEPNEDGIIEKICEKTLINFDGLNTITTSQYITKNIKTEKVLKEIIYCKDQKTIDFQKENIKVPEGYICTVDCNGNDVQHNGFTQISNRKPYSVGGCLPLTKSNLIESCVVLASKTTIQTNWIIDKDLYNFNKVLPEEFVNDCITYATFHNYVMSYNLDGSRLNNEFFFISHEKMSELANENNFDEMYNEAKTSKDSHLYSIIKDKNFSEEAKILFEKANELVEKSMKYRAIFNEEHPEVQILNWDAGWNQISRMLKAYMKDEFKEFQSLKKKLAEKICNQVYELGILSK